jgi:Zn-dependent protease with chaperone function
LGLKNLILSIPVVSKYNLVENSIAIIPVLLLFSIHWFIILKTHNKLFSVNYNKKQFILSKLKFIFPALIPWILINILFDILKITGYSYSFSSMPIYIEILFVALFFVLISIIFPFFIKYLWNCKPFSDVHTKNKILEMCKQEKVTVANILLWPLFEAKGLSAGIMGPLGKFRYILITPGLLDILEEEELEAVIYHEIGHIKFHHTIFYIFFILGYMIFSFYITYIINIAIIMLGYFNNLQSFFQNHYFISVSYFFIYVSFVVFYLRYVFGYISRNFERQADTFAFMRQGTARYINSSLEKIAYYSGNSRRTPSWHHYSVKQRIEYFDEAETNASTMFSKIRQHDKKVTWIKTLYLTILTLSTILLFVLSPEKMLSYVENYLYSQARLEKLVRDEPENLTYKHLLSVRYLENGADKKLISLYHELLTIEPQNYQVLNNLAWVYLTAENDTTVRNIEQGFRYAQKAYELKKEDYILDTLAEAYYLKGDFRNAIELEHEAKKTALKDKKDISHYEKQIIRFEKAIAGLQQK